MDECFQLRPATNADGEAVRRLVFEILREHGLTPDPAGTDAELFDIETSYFGTGGVFDVLVDAASMVVGSVGMVPRGEGCCELRKMYLAGTYRRRGLGKRLVQHALERARQLGFRRMELETKSVLQTAIKLYESFGFQRFEPEHWSAGSDRVDRAYFLELGGEDGLPGDAERGS